MAVGYLHNPAYEPELAPRGAHDAIVRCAGDVLCVLAMTEALLR